MKCRSSTSSDFFVDLIVPTFVEPLQDEVSFSISEALEPVQHLEQVRNRSVICGNFCFCDLVFGTGMGTYKTCKTNSHLSCKERNEDCLKVCAVCMFLERCGISQGDYFRKTAKSLDFRERPHSETEFFSKKWVTQYKPRSWLALVNEYADCAFSSIFQAIGDRQRGFTFS